MDGREAMAMSGPSSSYYIHRGLGAPGPGPQQGLHGPQSIRTMPGQNPGLAGQSSHIAGSDGGSKGPGFQLEPSSSMSMSMLPHGVNVGGSSAAGQGEPVKRKRGRPRKYRPDGSVALALSPLSASPPTAGSVSGGVGTLPLSGSGSGSATPKRGRGRPPGTGRKQQLASLGLIDLLTYFIA